MLLFFIAPLAAVAVMLVAGLGDFGMWEPHEVQHLGRTSVVSDGGGFALGDALATAGSQWNGHRELGARLPSAAFALFAALCLGAAALAFGGRKISLFALLVLAGSPVFLFHGRQATGFAPLLAAETLSFAGLAALALAEGKATAIGGIAAAAVGLPLAVLSAGTLVGIAVPSGAVAIAAIARGVSGSLRRKAALAAASVLCAGGVALFAVAAGFGFDAPLITSGLSGRPVSADLTAALAQVAYGWFPWSALLPLLVAFPAGDREEDATRRALRWLALGGIGLGLVAQTFYTALHGPAPLFLALPIALGAALVLDDLESSETAPHFAALVVLVGALVMSRDFAQQPASILTGYAIASLKAPDVFKPFVHAIIATAPFFLLVAAAGFFGGGGGALKRSRVHLLAPVAALAFGGFVAFSMVPELSVHFSPKHAMQTYERFAKKGEPIATFSAPEAVPGAKVLKNRSDLIEWLASKSRVFALLPPRELAQIDKEFRKAHGRHVIVLDRTSTRLILAASALEKGERDVNPLVKDVLSKPFPKAPANPMEVDFDGKLTLLGWEVTSPAGPGALKRGAEFTLSLYWRCEAPVGQSYKAFVHIDGPGPRINGDHDLLGGAYPTNYWSAGDYIRDAYQGTVSAVQETGSYTIRTGLYRGGDRMKVRAGGSATDNSLLLGTVPLR